MSTTLAGPVAMIVKRLVRSNFLLERKTASADPEQDIYLGCEVFSI